MKLLDLHIDFKANRFLLFQKYRVYFLLVVVTAVFDAVSTMLFMAQRGVDLESNWLVWKISTIYGPIWGPLLGKTFQLLAVWIFSVLVPRLTPLVCGCVIAINMLAVFINVRPPAG